MYADVKEPASVARAKDKTAFRVMPNRGGSAPGTLEEIIRDLEEEELMEQLAR